MRNGQMDESVLNSMMAVGIFRSWADVLEVVTMTDNKSAVISGGHCRSSSKDLTTNISSLRAFALQQERGVSATWDENEHGGWFARTWSDSSGWCWKVSNASVWWSNAYAIFTDIPPLNNSKKSNTDKLMKSLSEALYMYTDAGVIVSNKTVHGSYTDAWWAGAMYHYEALGLRGHQGLALATWQRHSLALHSEQFPTDLSGIWSSSDVWAKDGRGGCGGWEGSYCLHNTWTHTASLWGIPALAGVEFTQQGLIIRPQLDQPHYTIRSPLLGAIKATDSNNRAAFASNGSILTVNGRAVAGASWSEPQVVVPLPAGGLCWCVHPKPSDTTWCGTVLPAHCI